jgi:hypothetical protein
MLTGILSAGMLIGAASALLAATPTLTDNTPPTVDLTLSLQCRMVEGAYEKTIKLSWDDAVTKVEEARAQHYDPRSFDAGGFSYWWFKYAVENGLEKYEPSVRVAFNHGIPDGTSTDVLAGMRVVKATPDGITLRGISVFHAEEEGYIDRRTGHAMITWFAQPGYPEGDEYLHTGKKVLKQFAFECEPSCDGHYCRLDRAARH